MKLLQAVNVILQSPELLLNVLGAEPQYVEPLVGGNHSPVYKLTFANSTCQVLKFSDEAYWLRAEQLFLEKWADCGIRTPTVVKRGIIQDFDSGIEFSGQTRLVSSTEDTAAELPDSACDPVSYPVSYLLMELLPGENLFPLMEMGQLNNSDILQDLGRILARMHEPSASGYGEIQFCVDGQISGKWDTFLESLASPDWSAAINANLVNGALPDSGLDLVYSAAGLLDAHRSDLEGDCTNKGRYAGSGHCEHGANYAKGGSYVHNDFRAGNIIYDPLAPRPYAVIDPGAELTHPYLCLAYSLLLEEINGRNDPLDFRRGYEEVKPVNEEALHAALFLRALKLLPRWGKTGEPYAQPLHALFEREKAWLKEHF